LKLDSAGGGPRQQRVKGAPTLKLPRLQRGVADCGLGCASCRKRHGWQRTRSGRSASRAPVL